MIYSRLPVRNETHDRRSSRCLSEQNHERSCKPPPVFFTLGGLAGILSGGLMVIIWKQLNGGIFDVYEIVPGFLVSSLTIVLFSLLGLKPSEDQPDVSLFDKATQKDQEVLVS